MAVSENFLPLEMMNRIRWGSTTTAGINRCVGRVIAQNANEMNHRIQMPRVGDVMSCRDTANAHTAKLMPSDSDKIVTSYRMTSGDSPRTTTSMNETRGQREMRQTMTPSQIHTAEPIAIWSITRATSDCTSEYISGTGHIRSISPKS
ncbi:unannotated protein [freshwater metagenome]|uniref:Unannotated protein n=1 Tax=freshwater metagenome TaxID=449393 RepID=A0A6J6E8V8_9ZZZZ